MQGHDTKHGNKRHDKLGYNSVCHILGLGSDEGRLRRSTSYTKYKSDNISLRYILTSSAYDVCIAHNLRFMTARVRDRKGIGSGTYMGFMGVRTSTKEGKGFVSMCYGT